MRRILVTFALLASTVSCRRAESQVDLIQEASEAQLSRCGKCRQSWKRVREHSTQYAPHWGMFPLCEACWQGLSPEARLPYYVALIHEWESQGSIVSDEQYNAIIKAVLEGN